MTRSSEPAVIATRNPNRLASISSAKDTPPPHPNTRWFAGSSSTTWVRQHPYALCQLSQAVKYRPYVVHWGSEYAVPSGIGSSSRASIFDRLASRPMVSGQS
ncbi:hypothetical protein [Streptomyces sp. SID3343]|uniref:hypothetical protein n=1 Tax=Streptomyces sp. SID3343 TaxID=2690260 RepID=UPI001F17B57D|nr:hypothetical protein [Streptomyces sp. SID3343]